MKDGQKNREREKGIKTKAVCCFQHPPDLPPPTTHFSSSSPSAALGGTGSWWPLIGEDRLVVMAGVELVEWYQGGGNVSRRVCPISERYKKDQETILI